MRYHLSLTILLGLVILAAGAAASELTIVNGSSECGVGKPDETKVPARQDVIKMYPSLTPRPSIHAAYAFILAGGFQIDPRAASTWQLFEITDAGLKYVPGVAPARIDLASAGRAAQLSFEPYQLDTSKRYRLVAVTKETNGQYHCFLYPGDIQFSRQDFYTLKIDPSFAPDAELDNGKKTNVGRLGITIDIPSLVPNDFADAFFKMDALLSTESADTKTKIEAQLGARRSLLTAWYVPAQIDVKYIGNQRGSNQSIVGSVGVETIVPWAWATGATKDTAGSRGILWNYLVAAPLSPTLGISPQIEHIIVSSSDVAHRDEFRLSGSFHWNPIYLLPGLTGGLFDAGEARASDGVSFSARNVSLDFATRLWWLPQEAGGPNNGRNPFEYRIDLSLVVPTAWLQVATGGDFLRTASSLFGLQSSARFVLKYSTGANEADNFKRSQSVTFGMDVIK